MNGDLEKAIFLTINYFNFFDYPLKSGEIFKWLFWNRQETLSRKEVGAANDFLLDQRKIVLRDGFYFLPDREKIINLRQKRERTSLLKIKKAQRAARLLGLVPGVRMIAVCSNLGYLNAGEEADIDFFIVTEKQKIWSARFWCVFLMKVLNQRPNKRTMKNKICLSYFISEDRLNLEDTKVGEPDIHLAYLLSQYLLIYAEDDLWPRFTAANSWLKKYLPNFYYGKDAEKFSIQPRCRWLKRVIGKTQFSWEESFYKKLQLKIMPTVLQEMAKNNDKKVMINEQMLKLHLNDRRQEINLIISNFSPPGRDPAMAGQFPISKQ